MRDSGTDVLVDAARDIVGSLLARPTVHGRATVDKWAASSSPLLRRIAINALVNADVMSADEKIAWILERDFFMILRRSTRSFGFLRVRCPKLLPSRAEAF